MALNFGDNWTGKLKYLARNTMNSNYTTESWDSEVTTNTNQKNTLKGLSDDDTSEKSTRNRNMDYNEIKPRIQYIDYLMMTPERNDT